MEINLLFVLVCVSLLFGAVQGWKRGLLEEIMRIISGILGLLVLVVVAKGIGSFMQSNYMYVVLALVLLGVIKAIYKLVRFLCSTFQLVRALPVGKLVDRTAGAVLCLAEAVFWVWFFFLFTGILQFTQLNAWIQEQVAKSQFLTTLYYSNVLVELLRKVL